MSPCPHRTQYESPKFSHWLLGVEGIERGWEKRIETQKCQDLFQVWRWALRTEQMNVCMGCASVCPKGGKFASAITRMSQPD